MSVSKQQMLNNVSTLIREHVGSIKSKHATEMKNLKNSHTAELERMKETHASELASLKAEMEKKSADPEEIKQMQEHFDAQARRYFRLEQQLEQKFADDIEAKTKQIADLEAERDIYKTQTVETAGEMTKLVDEVERLKASEASVEKLSQKLKTLEQEHLNLMSDLSSKEENLRYANNLLKDNATELSHAEGRLCDLDHLRKEHDALLTQKSELEIARNNAESQRDTLKTSLKSMTTERDNIKITLDALKTEKETLETSLKSMTTERDDHQKNYEFVVTERDNIKKDRDSLQATHDECVADLQGVKAQIVALTKERDELNERVSKLDESTAKLEKAQKEFEEEKKKFEEFKKSILDIVSD